jgi:hypothetical protein
MILTLKNSMNDQIFDVEWVSSFKTTFVASLSQRMQQFFLAVDSLGVRACALDHRYSHLSGIADPSDITRVRDWILNEMKKTRTTQLQPSTTMPAPQPSIDTLISKYVSCINSSIVAS